MVLQTDVKNKLYGQSHKYGGVEESGGKDTELQSDWSYSTADTSSITGLTVQYLC